MDDILEKRELEKQHQFTGAIPKKINAEEVKSYVARYLYLPLTDQEFADIGTGFCLRWNYSFGQTLDGNDIKKAADQYLISIESPMDRGKMKKVVDLILEYLEEIGEWS